tara:strand:- start:28 stop:966 length:939 start_codon:yes stop_codon:yes gene_type:complete
MKNKVLVTGGAGYIGSKLVTKLVELKYDVTVIDKIVYDKTSLFHLFNKKNFKLIKGDVTDIKILKKIIKNFDYIIPLAALVGAPLCEKYPKEAIKINLKAIKLILANIKSNQRIIYTTTNSGYGIGLKGKFCDENTPLSPISLYGQTKVDAEKEILKYKNSISLRLATVFGYSYRMRTDLLVNNFVLRAIKEKKIELFEPNFRRNFIYIDDVVNGIIFSMMNFNKLKSNCYNLGLSNANITKLKLARLIKEEIPSLKISINENKKDPDKRDYFVSNRKIESKGFKAKTSLNKGIKELKDIYSIKDNGYNNNY